VTVCRSFVPDRFVLDLAKNQYEVGVATEVFQGRGTENKSQRNTCSKFVASSKVTLLIAVFSVTD
jgi:hypothetical protein